jgi:hypothetical protein
VVTSAVSNLCHFPLPEETLCAAQVAEARDEMNAFTSNIE